jgi:hypothetical protein
MNSSFDVEIVEDLTTEPITLQEAKDWLIVDEGFTDDMITALITSARMQLEKVTGLSFGEKELSVYWERLETPIELPYGPILEVSECVDDEDDDVDYELKGLTFKKLHAYSTEGLKVTYTAGYDTLPEALKTALKMLICYNYENRGDSNIVFPDAILRTVAPFRRTLWFGL